MDLYKAFQKRLAAKKDKAAGIKRSDSLNVAAHKQRRFEAQQALKRQREKLKNQKAARKKIKAWPTFSKFFVNRRKRAALQRKIEKTKVDIEKRKKALQYAKLQLKATQNRKAAKAAAAKAAAAKAAKAAAAKAAAAKRAAKDAAMKNSAEYKAALKKLKERLSVPYGIRSKKKFETDRDRLKKQ